MDYKGINDYEMIYRIRENDEESINVMIKKYEPIIINLAKKYFVRVKHAGVDMNDLIQEGRIALVRAINSYDAFNTAIFYTYASICIERRLITYCRNLMAVKHTALNYSINDDSIYRIGDVRFEPSLYVSKKTEEDTILKCKELLSFIDSNIFELRCNGFTYKEISTLLDLPFGTVDSRLCKIRKTLQRMKNKF